jgi:thioredoxin reductase
VSTDTAVAIIGAGPYGLSIAAHLRSAGIDHRIFGSPMQGWISGMPQGMHLKSYGFASNLYEPSGSFTLERFCAETSTPYSAEEEPIALNTFISYGQAFQQRFVPECEDVVVKAVTRSQSGFGLVLETGEVLSAQNVVIAVGMRSFGHVPPVLHPLPAQLMTHSSQHSSLARFDGGSVAVVGAGSSALDLVALLHARDVEVELFCRSPEIVIHQPTIYPRPIRQRLRHPQSPMGPGWRSRLSADGAPLYRFLPESFRLEFLGKHLGPAGGWFLREQVVGKLPIHLSSTIEQASAESGRAQLSIGQGGQVHQFTFDHVIAATGYKVDLGRLDFIGPEIRNQIACVAGYPVVSSNFESTVRGLYFAGVTTASSFGPLVRFACGAKLTSRRVSRHLGGRRSSIASTGQPARRLPAESA